MITILIAAALALCSAGLFADTPKLLELDAVQRAAFGIETRPVSQATQALSKPYPAKVEVPVEYDGAPQTVGFNPGYLQEALKVMEPGSEIRFEFSNAKSPGKLTDSDDYTYVVMPVSQE